MRLTLGNRPIVAIVLVAATFPAFAVASRALSPGGEAALHRRSRTLKLQSLMQRLGVKPVVAVASELQAGEKVRATVVEPRKLAAFGIRGARVGDVVWVRARQPAGTPAAAQELGADVTVETTDANGRKKTQTTWVPPAETSPGRSTP